MNDALFFWENIKKEIRQQNTTHEWVAKKAGVSFNTFQGWISKGIYPRANEAVRIAAVLNTSVEYLVTGAARDKKIIENISFHLAQTRNHVEAIADALKAFY
jgi:transcriptional regulator with XRE-family HTH domain